MRQVKLSSRHVIISLIAATCILASCNEWVVPGDLPGFYTGRERVIIRYDKDGQYIFRDSYVMISLIIDSTGQVAGMAGDATFEGCSVIQNRGFIGRQLGIKTDFLIKGILKGPTFDKDTIINKNISIPFNIENGELRGSLFLNTNGDSFPIIRILKLQKKKEI